MKARGSFRQLLLAAGGSVALVLGAFGPGSVDAAERDAVRACTRPGAGFFARDAAGQASGLEYDILRSFADTLKADLVIDDAPSFDELLTRAEGGRCHIAAAGITVTEERKKRFAFSTPYFPNRVLIVQKAPTAFLKTDDLKGQRIAVVGGTFQARLLAALPEVKVVSVNNDDALFDAVSRGQADALACDSAVVLHHLGRHPEFSTAFPLGERSFFAFALPLKSNLLGPLNEHLKTLTRTGDFARMLAKHFGEANAEFLASEIASNASKP
ncbi:MAG TPA: transporter substrate-binding domain-containing protein [Vicinamibacteria bacterium]|nr:transporter substrate-binding domain-containing protein [Vicinamibacteria bacterium]